MVSPRRSARSDPASRAPSARDPGAPPPLSTPRRLGVLVVVGALLLSILLAWGHGGTRPTADPTPVTSSEPTAPTDGSTPTPAVAGPVPAVAPLIIPPDDAVLTQRKVNLTITIPDEAGPLKGLELHVYRNGELAMDPVRVRDTSMTVRNVPLRRNENRLSVALANASGEGPRSEEVVVTVDDREPKIDIKEPDDGSVVNSAVTTVRGITDPGLIVTVRNPAVGALTDALADERGVFITEIRLDKEENRIEISTEDAAGNKAVRVLNVVRGEAVPDAKLSISRQTLKMGDLPASLTVRLVLNDPNGKPVDDVLVVFSISPPGFLSTETYETRTVDGLARWDDVVIAREGALKGNGFITAKAELGAGISTVKVSKPCSIE